MSENAGPITSVPVPTIDDLRVKLCYICREEERYDNPQSPKRLWIHPCNCTLVAHESCLLQWIETSQQDPSRAENALKCPQCGAVYELESENPLTLRIFDAVNKALSLTGRLVTAASVAVVLTSFGAGIYVVSTAYGAYAVQQFLGKEMYDLLLSDDPVQWPWHAFMNLPLVPFTLILSGTPLFESVSPTLPFFLCWPTTTPIISSQNFPLTRWQGGAPKLYPLGDLSPIRTLFFSWPPSPLIMLFLYPVARAVYTRMFKRFSHWVLNSEPGPQGRGPHRVIWARDDNGLGDIQIQINANAAARPRQQEQLAEEQQQIREERGGVAPAEAAERTTRITGASLGRLIGGSLILPAISNVMGSLLFRLSKRSSILSQILAVRPPLNGVIPPPYNSIEGSEWRRMSITRQFLTGLNLSLSVWSGTNTWRQCDPVWWRNSIGLGLFLVAKDCVRLFHLWLSNREIESRRVKSRSFEGVDVTTLDLIRPESA